MHYAPQASAPASPVGYMPAPCRARALCAAFLAILAGASGLASAAAPELRLHDGPRGATCRYFDEGAGVAWRHALGDWKDADGTAQGPRPFARARLQGPRTGAVLRFDITPLAREWSARASSNDGVLIAALAGSKGTARFASAQSPVAASRPALEISYEGGTAVTLAPVGDATLNCSTVRALGTLPTLRAGDDHNALLRFELPAPAEGRTLVRATLVLTTVGQQFGSPELGAFRVDSPLAGRQVPRAGLAAAYAGDAGIVRHPDVVFAEDFEAPNWTRHWSYVRPAGTHERVTSDAERHFEPLRGNALRIRIAKDQHLGLNAGFRFRERTGSEPEEIYFRYYLRLAEDWRPTLDGGKFPGIAATYGKAGWGGRKADGSNGWSMRGGFAKALPDGHILAGGTLLGTYAYLPGNRRTYGAFWPWSADFPGVLTNNRWYCIEQYVRVNTLGNADGAHRVWIDGRLALEREQLRMRDIDAIRIEEVWLNVYHGGSAVSPRDQHLFIDNVVIARRYIGPMAR